MDTRHGILYKILCYVHMIIIDHNTVMKAMGCLCFITPEISSIEKFCENYQLLNKLFLYLQKNATDAIL